MEDRYKLWVYARNDDGTYSIPDEVMLGVWKQMVEEDRAKTVFYCPGGVSNEWEWMAWVKSPSNLSLLIVDTQEKKIVFVAWINSIADRICFGHFCGLGRRTYRPEVGKLVMDYWSAFRNSDGTPFLRAIFAMIPEENEKAVKLAQGVGFTFLGVVPGLCEMVYEGRRVGGAFGYFIPENKEN